MEEAELLAEMRKVYDTTPARMFETDSNMPVFYLDETRRKYYEAYNPGSTHFRGIRLAVSTEENICYITKY